MKDDIRENGEDIGKKPSQKKQAQDPKDPGHLSGALRSLFDTIKDRDAAEEQRTAKEETQRNRSEAEDAAFIAEQFRNNPLPHEKKDTGPAFVPSDRVGTGIPLSDKQKRELEEFEASQRAKSIKREATAESREMNRQIERQASHQREQDYGLKKSKPAQQESMRERLLKNLSKGKDKDYEDDH